MEIGRNIWYSQMIGKYVIYTVVDGKEVLEKSDTKALAQARMKRLLANGYEYINPHKDKSL